MLEQWLAVLEKEKSKSITKLTEISYNKKILIKALEEIEIDYMTVKTFLEKMAKKGFKLNDDLSSNRESYNDNEEYRYLFNHINHHLLEIKRLPYLIKKEGEEWITKYPYY